MSCRDMMLWIGTSYYKIDCGREEVTREACAYGPRGKVKRCYVHEAEYRGCCRRIPTLPLWAVPGETRVFLIHSEGCHPHQGSLFGYYLLERFEAVVDPSTYAKLRDPNQIPWSDHIFQDILSTVEKRCDPLSLKGSDRERLTAIVREQFDERSRYFVQQIAREKSEFRKPRPRSWPSPEDSIESTWEELLESVLEEVIENWLEEVLTRLLNSEDMDRLPPRICPCHKRTDPGALYAVDALTALIIELFMAALEDSSEEHGQTPNSAGDKRLFQSIAEKARQQRKKERHQHDPAEEPPDYLHENVMRRGELILFPRPFPIIQRCPDASFRNYLRVDGDQLLSEVERSYKKADLVKVPYCIGPHTGPMTKTQLQAYLARELLVNQSMAGRFLEILTKTAAEDIAQYGRFVLPGFGSLSLESDGKIGFYAYKPLRDKLE